MADGSYNITAEEFEPWGESYINRIVD